MLNIGWNTTMQLNNVTMREGHVDGRSSSGIEKE